MTERLNEQSIPPDISHWVALDRTRRQISMDAQFGTTEIDGNVYPIANKWHVTLSIALGPEERSRDVTIHFHGQGSTLARAAQRAMTRVLEWETR